MRVIRYFQGFILQSLLFVRFDSAFACVYMQEERDNLGLVQPKCRKNCHLLHFILNAGCSLCIFIIL